MYFDLELAKCLILITDKSLLRGDVLVDDNATGAGQDRFDGVFLLHRAWEETEPELLRLLGARDA